MNNLPKLYSIPTGWEAETEYGIFRTSQKWIEKAKRELIAWLDEMHEPEAA